MGKRFLAFLCRVCPFCWYARRHPDSGFANRLRKMEKNCPACRAYSQVYKQPAQGKAQTSDE